MTADREQWATSVVLGDGDAAFVRPITTADAPALLAFHESQPAENLYRRFFSPKPTLSPAELAHFTDVDFHDRVALVLELHGRFAAWASYERWQGRDEADVAFMVDHELQGRGIATLLLEHLAAIARANGIQRFTAEVLSENRAMLRVFARAGWPVERHFDSGVAELEWPLTETARFVDLVEQREHTADARAITRLLQPRSIAVIGASDRAGSVGAMLWHNVIRGASPAFAVNASHPTVGGTPAYASVTDIPDDVTLALVAVPAEALVATIDECIAKRVRGAVIYTAVDGTDVDVAGLVEHARRNGLRIIGPASMGIASPRRGGGMQAALAPVTLPYGGVAISMQSGSLGASVLTLAQQLEMGVSWFVSLGDKCDVSGNDLLQYWEDDDDTRVVAIYTESFGNPRKFARLAKRVGRTRPIVAVRTGTAAIGSASDALYQQAGLIEVPTVRAMLDTARVLATQPVPRGERVAILTNSRSPGVLATAAVDAAGLTAVEPPQRLDWRSSPADFHAAIAAALAADDIDAVMVIHAPPIAAAPAPLDAIDDAAAAGIKPVVAVLLGRADGVLRTGSSVPTFSFPEQAAAVLGRMAAYSRWLHTEAEPDHEPIAGIDHDATRASLAARAGRGETTLSLASAHDLFAAYGVEAPHSVLSIGASDAEVAAVATAVGYPVVVKVPRRRIGRSAAAGIALDLGDETAVRDALAVMRASLGDDARTVVVQRMAPPGVDVRVCCTTDPLLGPVVTVGLGSLQARTLDTGASRLAPVSVAAAATLLAQSSVGAALDEAGIDHAPVIDAIRRISQLAFDHPEIDVIDVDPMIAGREGCWVTDARVELRADSTAARSEPPLRRLV